MSKIKASKRRQKRKDAIIPYVKGFRPTTKRKQISALGYDKEVLIPAELQLDGFNPIKKCTSIDDWLAQYKEEGQTYEDYLLQCPWLSRRKLKYCTQEFVSEGKNISEKYPNSKIYIFPVGDFSNESLTRLEALIEYTELFLGLPVRKIPGIQLENDNRNIYFVHSNSESNGGSSNAPKREKLRSRYKEQNGKSHQQICICENMHFLLKPYLPADALCMIALTNQDLYEAKSDLFIAGLAAGNQRVAIFSLFRYNPNLEFSTEFWYDIKKRKRSNEKESSRLLLQRGCRLLVHEISHLLGIAHCVYFDCCMNGSGHLKEDFGQPMHLCPVDLRKLQTLVGFDAKTRYTNLEAFYTKHGMTAEAQWVRKRLVNIQASH